MYSRETKEFNKRGGGGGGGGYQGINTCVGGNQKIKTWVRGTK